MVRPTTDALPWWKFVKDATLRDVREKNSQWKWQSIKAHKKRKLRYIHLYKRKRKLGKSFPPGDAEELATLEERLPYQDVLDFRGLANASIARENRRRKELEAQQQQASRGWFGGWFGGSAANGQEIEEDVYTLTLPQWRELYTMSKFGVSQEELDEKQAASSKTPKEYVKMSISYDLRLFSIELKRPRGLGEHASDEHEGLGDTILSAFFEGFTIQMLMRMRSMAIEGGLRTLNVLDFYTLNGHPVDLVIIANAAQLESKNALTSSTAMSSSSSSSSSALVPSSSSSPMLSGTNKDDFLAFSFELNPLDGKADTRVSLIARRPLNIQPGMKLIDRLASFFTHTADTTQLRLASSNTYDTLRQQAELQIKYAMDTRKRLDVRLEVVAPNVIIPCDFTSPNGPMLVLMLGHLALRSDFESKQRAVSYAPNTAVGPAAATASPTVSEDYFYDRFTLTVTDTCAFVTTRDAFWNSTPSTSAAVTTSSSAILLPKKTELSLVERFDVSLALAICTVPSNDLAQIKIAGRLPSLRVAISPTKIGQVLAILDGFLSAVPSATAKAAAAASAAAKSEIKAVAAAASGASDELPAPEPVPLATLPNSKQIQIDFEISQLAVVIDGKTSKGGEITFLYMEFDAFKVALTKVSSSPRPLDMASLILLTNCLRSCGIV